MDFFIKVEQNQTLPIEVKCVWRKVHVKRESRAGRTRLDEQLHLGIMSQGLKVTDAERACGGFFLVEDSARIQLTFNAEAVKDEAFLKAAVEKYGDKIAVGADVKDGYIAIKGWVESSQYTIDAFFEKMQQMGVKTIICTDISKDGAMRGTNLELYSELSEKYSVDIIASGGVSTLDDVRALRAMNVYGAIIGRAYYIGAIDLKEAIEVSV